MVTILGIVWVALGVLVGAPSALVGMMVLAAGGEFIRLPERTPENSQEMPALLYWLGEHIGALIGAQILVALLMLAAGVALLRRRAWARSVLESLCWLGIVVLVAWNGWFASWAVSILSEDVGPRAAEAGFVLAFVVLVAVMSTLFYGGTMGALLWMLRHRNVREALR